MPRTPERFRDARLFLVATEGEHTERLYFEALGAADLIDTRRVTVRVLPTDAQTHDSSPTAVLDRCRAAAEEIDRFEEFDESWLLLDVDRWARCGQLQTVLHEAGQQRISAAVSNPCFELWLLLHHTDDLAGVTTACQTCVTRLQALAPGFGKKNIPQEMITRDTVNAAIARGEATMRRSIGAWPDLPGSSVGELVRRLVRVSREGDAATPTPAPKRRPTAKSRRR